jgi:hypothetical protein
MTQPLSLSQLQAEYDYRVSERLGILCGTSVPTDAQLAIATSEADQWLKQYQESVATLPKAPVTPRKTA